MAILSIEVIKKMTIAYDAIKQTLGVDLYDLNLDVPGGLLGVTKSQDGWRAQRLQDTRTLILKA